MAPIIKPLSLKAGKPVKIQIDYTQREDVAVMQFDILKTSKPTSEQILAEVGDADAVVTPSSGNVFTDLGFGPGEAAVMGMRADLMARLRVLVQTEGWTQAQAADRFGIAQSRVSDLLRGKWDKFSLDILIMLAARAGRKVELAVS